MTPRRVVPALAAAAIAAAAPTAAGAAPGRDPGASVDFENAPSVTIRAATVDRGRRHLVLDIELGNPGPAAVVALVVPPVVYGPGAPEAACGVSAPALGLGPVVQIRPAASGDAPASDGACAAPPALPPPGWHRSLLSLPPGGTAPLLVTVDADDAWAQGLSARFVVRWAPARSLLRRLQRQAFEATRGLYLVAAPALGLQRPERTPRALQPFSGAAGSDPAPLRDREGTGG